MKKHILVLSLFILLLSTFAFAEETVVEVTGEEAPITASSLTKDEILSQATNINVIVDNDMINKVVNMNQNGRSTIYAPAGSTMNLTIELLDTNGDALDLSGVTLTIEKESGNPITYNSNGSGLQVPNIDGRTDDYFSFIVKVDDVTVNPKFSIGAVHDKVVFATVKAPDNTNYTGRIAVVTNIKSGNDIGSYCSYIDAVDGKVVVALPDNASSKDVLGLMMIPEDNSHANSQYKDILSNVGAGSDLIDLGVINLQTPTTTITVKEDASTTLASGSADLQLSTGSGSDTSWFSMRFNFSESFKLASLGNMNTDVEAIIKKEGQTLLTKSFDMSVENTLTWDASVKPWSERVARYEVTALRDSVRTPGTKFLTDGNNNMLYLPFDVQGSETTSTLEFKFYDKDDVLLDLEGAEISLDINESSHATEPSYDKTTGVLTYYPIAGGFGDWFSSDILIDNERINKQLDYMVFTGKLGLLNLNSPEGPYNGMVNYNISYRGSNGGTGSNSNGRSYNGIFPIPLQDGLLDIDYAYLLLWPESEVNGNKYANAEFKDLTGAMTSSDEFFDLGNAVFQVPTYSANVVGEDDQPWNDVRFSVAFDYTGDTFNLHQVSAQLNGMNDYIFFAPLGTDFSTTTDLELSQWGKLEKINTTIDVASNTTTTLKYVPEVQSLQGNLLLPDGSPIPNGNGREVHINIIDKQDPSIRFYQMTNLGEYKFKDLVDGREYQIEVTADRGDFDDLSLTDAYLLNLVYHSAEGTYSGTNEFGESFDYTVDASGTINLDIRLTEAVLIGQLFMGSDASNESISVTILDSQGNYLGNGSAHTIKGENGADDKHGMFLLGGFKGLDGDYTIVVDEPKETLYYTGTSVDITLPYSGDLKIYLPESKIYGKMTVDSEHTSTYENNFRRVYVNVFDEYGKYIKNGRVRSDGNFAVSDLAPGRYFGQAFVSPYSTLAENYSSSEKVAFIVGDSGKSTFDVPLTRKMAIGTVSRPTGGYISGAWVTVYDQSKNLVASVSTDDDGKFVLPLLADGQYTIKALAKDGYNDSFVETLTVANGQVSNMNVLTVHLTGTFLDGNIVKTDASHVTIVVYNSKMELITSTEMKSDGSYSLGGVKPGSYFIQAIPNTDSSDTPSQMLDVLITTTKENLDINLGQSELSGLVKNPDGSADTKSWVKLYKNNAVVAMVKTTSTGAFKFGNLEDNVTYKVQAGGEDSIYLPSSQVDANKGSTDVLLTLRNTADIKGILKKDNVTLKLQKIYVYKDKIAVKTIQTNIFGEFSLCDLETGTYSFVVPVGSENFVFTQEYNNTPINMNTVSVE